jgi:hypothetical protein
MASKKDGGRTGMVGPTLFIVLAITIGVDSASATTIVVLKTQSEIIVGADSMIRSIGQENPILVCSAR